MLVSLIVREDALVNVNSLAWAIAKDCVTKVVIVVVVIVHKAMQNKRMRNCQLIFITKEYETANFRRSAIVFDDVQMEVWVADNTKHLEQQLRR